MPRKTKKQKLLAELRKKQTSHTLDNRLQQQSSSSLYSFNLKSLNQSKTIETKKEHVENFSIKYISYDLKKTLILTVLAIVFMLVIYWGWRF